MSRITTLAASAAVGALALAFSSPGSAQIFAQGGYAAPAPSSYPPEYRRGAAIDPPDFDAIDDDEGVRPQGATALPPPGPIMSPDDPRYGRAAPPVYSERAPQGPVMSPDDPRYGRPAGPPAVVYADRPPVGAGYQERGPGAGFIDPGEPRSLRPPEAVGAPGLTGSVEPPAVGRDGRPMTIAALPPEDQPEMNAPKQLPPHLRRQEVAFNTKEPAGTIVVDTPNTHLYYVLGNGRAIRYGIRVGRDGFRWSGVQKVTRKTEWPDWHPPTEMIERQPYLPRFMAGGEGNPLGARAMYLGNTVYRIHGTNQPSTIGKTASSGCFGLLNEDVMDLFERVKVGTRVVVLPGSPPPSPDATAYSAPAAGASSATASAAPLSPMAAPQGNPGTSPSVVPPLPAPVTIR